MDRKTEKSPEEVKIPRGNMTETKISETGQKTDRGCEVVNKAAETEKGRRGRRKEAAGYVDCEKHERTREKQKMYQRWKKEMKMQKHLGGEARTKKKKLGLLNTSTTRPK